MLLDDCYISFVNMDHRKDRLARMRLTLAAAGIGAVRTRGRPWQEFNALDPRFQVMLKRTPGALGCYHSQMDVMAGAMAQEKHAFVMEDDLIICEDFKKRMELISAFAETHEWDVFWMGGTFHINPPYWHQPRDAVVTDDPRFMQTFGAFSTHAYIVNKSSLRRVGRLLGDLMIKSMGIDWSFIQIEPHLKTYAFVPGSIIQYDNKSDIGKGYTVFSGFSKLGPYWYQNKMEDFDPTTYNWHEAS